MGRTLILVGLLIAGVGLLMSLGLPIGRLTVTTPVYNTAVIAVNQGSFPYGGVELARFF